MVCTKSARVCPPMWFVLLQAGERTLQSHVVSSSILNPKQKGAVERAARSAPLALLRGEHCTILALQHCIGSARHCATEADQGAGGG